MSRDAWRTGRELIYQAQKKLKHPPDREKINSVVRHIVRDADLKHDIRLPSFILLATCALLGKESMHNHFQRRHKHGRNKKG